MALLKFNFSNIAKNASFAVHSALEATASDIVNITQQLAPVDTGALRASYKWEWVKPDTVKIYSDYDEVQYAFYVEYGTERMSAQPHFTPAFLQAEKTFKVRFEQLFAKIGR